ncbi:exosortase-associated protein EpsI, B-type [Methylotenera sp.]|uniref:exosortase-associated protein EpsI, B-type n=1 Tax=Methylotenera sp. TaxID=2051956 RepID=UPI002EDB30DE
MNRHHFITPVVICLLMISAMALGFVLKPHQRMADELPPLSLTMAIPERFSGWSIDKNIVPVSQSADVQAKLDEIYSQTLARTYINTQGQRIMLSIAYGADQSGDGNQVHRPEFCYTAQGFQLLSNIIGNLKTQYGTLPVRRLLAVQGPRNEPITYWVTVGDKATLPGISRKLKQLAYGLTGTVPDGMLVRVSSIDSDSANAYKLQEKFIQDLLQAMPTQDRARVAGRFGA